MMLKYYTRYVTKKGFEEIPKPFGLKLIKKDYYKPFTQHSAISATEGPVKPNFSARIL